MSRLVQHTLEYLKDYYPRSSFDVWRKQTKGPPGFTARHAIGVVNLARLTGEDTLLPVALLTCCGLDEAIVRGCKREDGSREQLSLEDIGLCFKAKGKLVEAAVAMCLRICSWKKISPKCTNKPKTLFDLMELGSSRKTRKRLDTSGIDEGDGCREALRNATLDLPRRVSALCSGRGGPNLLLNFENFYGDVRKQLCKECWAVVQDRDLAERRVTWSRLPELLGITVDRWGRS
ncbi:hypothetical protein LXA43DRAFT_992451 [Ganoderma leucocontextum]|nr:hypothetical protein LXA43DRAFT_992451 [Ganoderma leucocontextum]